MFASLGTQVSKPVNNGVYRKRSHRIYTGGGGKQGKQTRLVGEADGEGRYRNITPPLGSDEGASGKEREDIFHARRPLVSEVGR